jgi:DNA-binding NarL/FixJ family response regulator
MSESAAPVLVYLLDDHAIVRRGLRDLFESEDGFEVVGESGSALEAQRRIPALHPDVAVLDAPPYSPPNCSARRPGRARSCTDASGEHQRKHPTE